MTIFNAKWRQELNQFVYPALFSAHPDLTRIVGILRDTSVEVWTETPSDSSKIGTEKAYSMEGWRVHFGGQGQRLTQWATTHGAALEGYDAQAKAALDGFLVSIGNIGPVFSTIMANYVDLSGHLIQTTVSQTDRDTLSAAIEAELQ